MRGEQARLMAGTRGTVGFSFPSTLGTTADRLRETGRASDKLVAQGRRRGVCATLASSARARKTTRTARPRRARAPKLDPPVDESVQQNKRGGRVQVHRQDPNSGLLGSDKTGARSERRDLSKSNSRTQTGRAPALVQEVGGENHMSKTHTESEEPRIRGRKKRKPRKTNLSNVAPFKTFEQELREESLLKHSEEIELARDIQELVAAENVKKELATKLERTPTMTEWAEELSITPADLQRRIQVGMVSKKRLVKANIRLVNDLVNKSKFPPSMVNPQDLLQEGCIGLVRAAEKFDGTKGFRFSTYATWWVRANIIRGIDTNSRLIRLPVRVKETFHKIKKRRNELAVTLKREPTEEEVAKATKMTVAKMRLVVETYGHRAASLDEVTNNSSGEETFNRTLGDSLTDQGDIEASIVETHLRRDLDRVLKEHLKPRERVALRLRYGLENGQPLCLREVGSLMELSSERVRQIIRQALGKLRDPSVQTALREYLTDV